MLISTHKLIGKKLLETMDNEKKQLFIKENHFIWGTIKPDFVSKYKLKKHYMDESFVMIINKIFFLARLSLEDLNTGYSINKFSQELGVVCHFLCDFFCMPHNLRWEFKKANVVKDHILYERNLDKVSKEFHFDNEFNDKLTNVEVIRFIKDMRIEYELNNSYENDLKYSFYVCNSVINMIMDSIMSNESYITNIIY